MTDKQIIYTFDWCKEIGLETYSFNMIGVPFETKQSIKKTIELNKKIKADYVGVSIFNAYKGTEIYDLCKKNYWLKDKDATSYFKESNEPMRLFKRYVCQHGFRFYLSLFAINWAKNKVKFIQEQKRESRIRCAGIRWEKNES